MITQQRVWELMSGSCRYINGMHCSYYDNTKGIRFCKCETCPLLGLVAIDVWKTGE
jgi:hypothetical protein